MLVRPRASAPGFRRPDDAADSAFWSRHRRTGTILAAAAALAASHPPFAAATAAGGGAAVRAAVRAASSPHAPQAPARVPAGSPSVPAQVFDCSGSTIYAYQRGNSPTAAGALLALASNTVGGPSVAAIVAGLVPGGGFANALGVTAGGTAAYLVDQTSSKPGTVNVHRYNVETSTWTTYPGTAGPGGPGEQFVAGAVDPADSVYYYASFHAGTSTTPGTATVYGFNTLTETAIPGIVATFDLPVTSIIGPNGDLAFDTAGNMYVLESAGRMAALGIVHGPIPATGSVNGAAPTLTRVSTIPDPAGNQYNGVAFDNVGNMYAEYSSEFTTYLEKLNPATGAVIAGPTPLSDNKQLSVDLGVCSANPTLTLRKNIVGRFDSAVGAYDQFDLSITGGGVTVGNTATTTGLADGVQPATAGPIIAASGTTYTLAESAHPGTLTDYHTTYACTESTSGVPVVPLAAAAPAAPAAPIAAGSGASFQLTFPATVPGQVSPAVLCTFTNDPVAAAAALTIQTAASPHAITAAGQKVAYRFTVANTGNVTLTDVGVRESAFSGKGAKPAVNCPAQAQSLPPAASVTCTASYTVVDRDLARRRLAVTARATGLPPIGSAVTSPPSTATVTVARTPAPGGAGEPPVTIPQGVEAGHPGTPDHGNRTLELLGATLTTGAVSILIYRRRRRGRAR